MDNSHSTWLRMETLRAVQTIPGYLEDCSRESVSDIFYHDMNSKLTKPLM